MKKNLVRFVAVLSLTLSAASFVGPSAFAAEPAVPGSQGRMPVCKQEAGDRKGEELKAFMKTCLSAGKTSQQDKMKRCNREATGKKGDERRAFMSTCLKA